MRRIVGWAAFTLTLILAGAITNQVTSPAAHWISRFPMPEDQSNVDVTFDSDRLVVAEGRFGRGSPLRSLRVLDTVTGKERAVIAGELGLEGCYDVRGGRAAVIETGERHRLCLVDLETGTEQTLDLSDTHSLGLGLSPDGSAGYLFEGLDRPDGTAEYRLRVFDAVANPIATLPCPAESKCAFSPGGLLVHQGVPGEASFWDPRTRSGHGSLPCPLGRFPSFTDDGRRAWLETADACTVYDLSGPAPKPLLRVPINRPYRARLTPDGRKLVIVPDKDESGPLEVWDVTAPRKVGELRVESIWSSPHFSPDGRFGIILVQGEGGGAYPIIDLDRAEVLWTASKEFAPAFTPDSRWVCGAGEAGALEFRDVATGDLRAVIPGPGLSFTSGSKCADGRYLWLFGSYPGWEVPINPFAKGWMGLFPPRSHNVRVVEWPSLRKVFHLESTQVDSWSEMAPDGRFLVTMLRGKGEWQIIRYDVPGVRPWLLIGLVTALTGRVLLAGRWLFTRSLRRRPSGTPPADSSPAAPPAALA